MTEENSKKVWLLEESTLDKLPEPLERLIAAITTEFNSSQDCRLHLLAIAILYTTYEMGFTTTSQESPAFVKWGFDAQRIRNEEIPNDFKRQTHFRCNLFLPGDPTKCVLLAMKSGESLLVTLTAEPFPGGSVALTASRFIPFFNRQKVAGSFRNLKELSCTVKNVCYPVMNQILAERGQLYPGILGLPEVDLVLRWLDAKSKQNLARACKDLADMVSNFRSRNKKK